MIRPYLSDMINDHKAQGNDSGKTIIKHKTQGELKIQLTMEINFISSKRDSDDIPSTMRTKSHNIGNDNIDDIDDIRLILKFL